MNLLQLQYFRQLAKDENFTKSAEALYISQPALSQMISRLEAEIGAQLFTRSGKKIRLNSNGELFLEYVNRALHEIDLGLSELSKLQRRNGGEISFNSMCGIYSLSHIMIQFQEMNPQVKLTYKMCNAEESIRSILDYEIEFAIINRPAQDSRLENEILYSLPVFACLGKGHPLADQKIISISDLRNSKFICNEITTDRYETETICENFGFKPDIAINCNDPQLISTILSKYPYVMLQKSLSLCYRENVSSFSRDNIIPFREKITSPLIFIRRKQHHFSSDKEEFFQYIRTSFREECIRSEQIFNELFKSITEDF